MDLVYLLRWHLTYVASFVCNNPIFPHRVKVPVDYMLRLLGWTRQMLMAVSVKRETGNNLEACEELERACLTVTGMHFYWIKRHSPEDLLEFLGWITDGFLKSLFIVDLLIEYAQICEESDDALNEIASLVQAYYLLSEAIDLLSTKEKEFYIPKLHMLTEKLSIYKDNPYIQSKLIVRRQFWGALKS